MIFSISNQYATENDGAMLSDVCSLMMKGRHYISCDVSTRELIIRSIMKAGSLSQQQLLPLYKGFDITKEIRNHFTTIDVSTITPDMLNLILTKPSRILMENSIYEWGIYKHIIGTYKKDRKYKNVFALLELAKAEGRISYLHGGGFTSYTSIIEQNNTSDYKDVLKFKLCVVFDRDTDDMNSYHNRKNSLFRFLCKKDSGTIGDNDIYTLNQSEYIWHMWYKYAIDNYFPNKCYEAIGADVNTIPLNIERDYFNFDKVSGYSKNQLPLLVQNMNRTDYEKELRKFSIHIGGKQEVVSELQLLLLKLVKII